MTVTWQTQTTSVTSALTGGCALADGRILFVNGVTGNFAIATINPGSSPFLSYVDSVAIPATHLAEVITGASFICLLSDGRVFWGGGADPAVGPTAASYFITVSGNTVSYAAATALPNPSYGHSIKQLADGRLLSIGHTNNDQTVWFGTISGNTISWVTTTQGPVGGASNCNFVQLQDGRILLNAANYNDAQYAIHSTPNLLGTINGNTISWVVSTGAPGGYRTSAPLILLSDGRVVLAAGKYWASGYVSKTDMYVGTVSGNSISWVADTTIPVGALSGVFANVGQRLLLISSRYIDYALTSEFITSYTTHTCAISEPASAAQTSTVLFFQSAARTEPATAAQTANGLQISTNTISEPVSAAQTSAVVAGTPAAISEPATANSSQVGSRLLPATISETATSAQAATAAQLLPAAQTDAAIAAQTSSSATKMNGATTEPASAANMQTALYAAVSSISETATAAQSNTGVAVMVAATIEPTSAAQTSLGVALMPVTITESADASNASVGGVLKESTISEVVVLGGIEQGGLFKSAFISEAAGAGGSSGPAQYWG